MLYFPEKNPTEIGKMHEFDEFSSFNTSIRFSLLMRRRVYYAKGNSSLIGCLRST